MRHSILYIALLIIICSAMIFCQSSRSEDQANLEINTEPVYESITYSVEDIPAIYTHINIDSNGYLFAQDDQGVIYTLKNKAGHYSDTMLFGDPTGTDDGISFNFHNPSFQGTLYFGLHNLEEVRNAYTVFYKKPASIDDGKAGVSILELLSGKYDLIDWEGKNRGYLGYRVCDTHGNILYDGKVAFSGTGPFTTDTTITCGPYVNMLEADSAVIAFDTSRETSSSVRINNQTFENTGNTLHHEITVSGLSADTTYEYTVIAGNTEETYSLETALEKGSRQAFTFAFGSDSRSGTGGGERHIFGCNGYIMKKFMALAAMNDAKFIQFTGDMINGYIPNVDEMILQYKNWLRVTDPYAHYIPVYATMGNHESLVHYFTAEDGTEIYIDKFPFDTVSSETIFASVFSNYNNGPDSEDGSAYDPDPDNIDFPTYQENVYYYTYGNIAMIVLNSNYWYSRTLKSANIYFTGSNLHGYLMDNQLKWLEETLNTLNNDPAIDHIFVTQHVPVFPNGGHSKDDMWYSGDNSRRTYVGETPVEKGILERRDDYLRLLLASEKVIAILTGDEHNYCRLEITDDMVIHPDNYDGLDPVQISEFNRNTPIQHITNGSVGAPYYAQEELPWSDNVRYFTTQYALCLFHVDDKKIELEVVNPDTLTLIEKVVIKNQ